MRTTKDITPVVISKDSVVIFDHLFDLSTVSINDTSFFVIVIPNTRCSAVSSSQRSANPTEATVLLLDCEMEQRHGAEGIHTVKRNCSKQPEKRAIAVN